MPKYRAYQGGGVTFYLGTEDEGAIIFEAKSKKEAELKADEVLGSYPDADLILSDDPDANGEWIIEEVE